MKTLEFLFECLKLKLSVTMTITGAADSYQVVGISLFTNFFFSFKACVWEKF